MVRLGADQDVVSRRDPAERGINEVACPHLDDAPLVRPLSSAVVRLRSPINASARQRLAVHIR
jgi:hypothetical protein